MAMHSRFETAEPGAAEEFLSDAYVDLSLELPEDHAGFRLADDRIDAGPFQFDQMTVRGTASAVYEPEVELFATRVRKGTMRLRQSRAGVDEILAHGEVALIGQPGIDSVVEVEDFGQEVVSLNAASPARRRRARARGAAADLHRGPPGLPGAGADLAPGARPGRRDAARGPGIVDAPVVVGSAERMLAGLLLATFPNTGTTVPARRDDHDSRSPDALRRAISFIDSNADLDIGIGEIAAAASVSSRAVQLAFRRHLGTTPTAYLRRVRLDYAHREMLGAAPGDGLTVTEVAYRWGFSSPSRFAERYRAVFGGSPSQTLRG